MNQRDKKIILVSIFALAAFLIVFRFTDTPKVWIDEGIFTNVAESVFSGGTLGIQTAPGEYFRLGPILTANYPVIYPLAMSFKIFGIGIWQARLPMLLYMFALVVLFYLFTKKRYGFSPALLSLLLLLSFSPFYGNGRSVLGEVPGLVFLVLGLLLLLYLEEGAFSSKKLALFSGLAFGLSVATKPIYLILLSVALLITLVFWWRKIQNKKIILPFALGVFLPLLFWFCINFPTKELASSVIPTFLNQSGSSLPLLKTAITNFSKFFTESTPILFMFTSVIVFFVFLNKKLRTSLVASEFIILLFIALNWLTFLRGSGWYRYFFPAHTLLYLLFPAAILSLARYFQTKTFRRLIFAIPILLILFQFVHLIFFSQTSFMDKRDRNTELSKEIGKIDSSKKVLFYNSVEAIVFYKSTNYDQYLSMAGLFEAGNKEALINPNYDFILITHYKNYDYPLPCYTEKQIDRYSLFTRIPLCAKK